MVDVLRDVFHAIAGKVNGLALEEVPSEVS